MSEFVLEGFVQELRAAALAEEPVKRVRELMEQTFQYPEAIRAAMPVYDSDDEILFEDDSISIWFVRFVPGLHIRSGFAHTAA